MGGVNDHGDTIASFWLMHSTLAMVDTRKILSPTIGFWSIARSDIISGEFYSRVSKLR
jgi:hypothetical protein